MIQLATRIMSVLGPVSPNLPVLPTFVKNDLLNSASKSRMGYTYMESEGVEDCKEKCVYAWNCKEFGLEL